MTNQLRENIDFVWNERGEMVLTREFLIKRGHCCQSGCLNCPYDYSSKVDPNVPSELQNPWGDETEHYDFNE